MRERFWCSAECLPKGLTFLQQRRLYDLLWGNPLNSQMFAQGLTKGEGKQFKGCFPIEAAAVHCLHVKKSGLPCPERRNRSFALWEQYPERGYGSFPLLAFERNTLDHRKTAGFVLLPLGSVQRPIHRQIPLRPGSEFVFFLVCLKIHIGTSFFESFWNVVGLLCLSGLEFDNARQFHGGNRQIASVQMPVNRSRIFAHFGSDGFKGLTFFESFFDDFSSFECQAFLFHKNLLGEDYFPD